jgi:transcription termination factor NusG
MPILAAETSLYPSNLLEEFAVASSDRRWWALHTKPRQEKALARQLLAQETPFYLPLIPRVSCIGGRRVRSLLPLFGGYLFLFGTDDERMQSLATKRIAQILPVPQAEVMRRDLQSIRGLIEAGVPLTPEGRLQPGRRVRVKSGSLMGLEGVVVERRGEDRLLVAVHFLEQGVSIQISDFQVEPI